MLNPNRRLGILKKMFKHKQALKKAPGEETEKLAFVKEMTPFEKILQKFGPSPWSDQAGAVVHTISDSEDELAQYLLIYRLTTPVKKEAAAVWLSWKTCPEVFLSLAACKNENMKLHQDLQASAAEAEKWKFMFTSTQIQVDSLKDWYKELKQQSQILQEQAKERKKIEKENQVLQGMVKKLTLEQGRAPADHDRCKSIIKHLKQKLGFVTRQVAGET